MNHGLKPPTVEQEEKQGSITGSVSFHGAWPDSTEEVRVAVYADFPSQAIDFYKIRAYSDYLPIESSECDYTVALDPGIYELVMVVLRKQGVGWGPNCFAGMYYSPVDTTRHGVITVESGQDIFGIDILVDLSRVGVLPPELEGIFN